MENFISHPHIWVHTSICTVGFTNLQSMSLLLSFNFKLYPRLGPIYKLVFPGPALPISSSFSHIWVWMCLRGKLGLLACGFFYVNANWRFSRLRLEIVMATETRDCFGNFPKQKISKTWHWYNASDARWCLSSDLLVILWHWYFFLGKVALVLRSSIFFGQLFALIYQLIC